MALDLSKIKAKKSENLLVEPVEIFQSSKVSDQNINDLWLAQGDALRSWHKIREKHDVGVVLNTGAGKTLVGLLMAKSLVNETRGKVLYACSSIQLVDQTVSKANGYGLPVTSYFRGDFSNDLFHRGKAPCITTYQALFNGRSIFFREEIDAVIFDDAHAAEHLLRDHFSLKIQKQKSADIYSELVALFKEYHQQIGMTGSFEELGGQGSTRQFFVPPFELRRQFGEVIRILASAGLTKDQDTTFAWEHLKDHIDLCCLFISNAEITFTPPFVPTHSLSYFDKKVRRIYLSATLSAPDAFTRTFGVTPDEVIAPTTTAGECERLILFPDRLDADHDDVTIAKSLLKDRKALVLVPTYSRAKKWEGFATPPEKNAVATEVETFKIQGGSPKLLLAARYDGVDLPGDTCRVMVVDDLPMGVGPLERYLWEYLNLSNTLRSTVASRIVQSFGRISRGMSDHGVVLITGTKLVEWLLTPKNTELLPPFLQKQLYLGFEISDNSEEVSDYRNIIEQCLTRDGEWLETYENFMSEIEPLESGGDKELVCRLAKAEAEYGNYIWNRDYPSAAKCLSRTLEDAFSFSTGTGAWHSLWLGSALHLLGDHTSAYEMYQRAHSAHKNIPPIPSTRDIEGKVGYPSQIIEVDRQFSTNPDGLICLPKKIYSDLAHLDGSGSSSQTEESLRALGQYLGLNSSRPDNEFGTGPDVLWQCPDMPALCIEVKTDKGTESQYQKKEVGQLSDHVQWVKDHTDAKEIIPIFVGPISPASGTANPPDNFLVISLDQFKTLADILVAALTDSAKNALPLLLRGTIEQVFADRNLLWPKCFEMLEHHNLKELCKK